MRSIVKSSLGACLLAAGILSSGTVSADKAAHGSAAINVIFDTDMWGDIDDMLALAMVHALHDRHEINLLAGDDQYR